MALGDPWSAYSQVGLVADQTSPAVTSPGSIPGIGRATGPAASVSVNSSLLSLDNPLTWFGLILAATFGLVGFSSSARIGKARGSISLNKGS
jgi:hypothetical protein